MKNVINAVMVLTGTFIGAGFASGKEIWQYFGVFGDFGMVGIALSCLLLSAFAYCTACNITSLGEDVYVKQLCSFKWVNWLLNGYMVLMLCTMITAFGECLNQTFGLPKLFGVVLMDLATMVILYFGAKGLVKLSTVVTPLIISGIVFSYLSNNIMEVFSYNNFVTSSVVYTSYNVISLPFIMSGLKESFSNKKQITCCSTLFGVLVFCLAFCVLGLLKFSDTVAPIPLITSVSSEFSYILIVVLAMSMLTTAVSNGHGFINGVAFDKMQSIVFLGAFTIVFSLFSFGFIIKYLYSLFGYMGLYIFIKNFYIFLKNKEKTRK